MDDADRASEQEQIFLDAAIRAARGVPGQRTGKRTCTQCGETIEPKRRALLPHTQHCADCAHIVERLRNRGGI